MEEIICEGCGHKIGVNSLKKGSCVLCGNMDLPLKATKAHSSVSSSTGLEGPYHKEVNSLLVRVVNAARNRLITVPNEEHDRVLAEAESYLKAKGLI